jgi:hypothetical protein
MEQRPLLKNEEIIRRLELYKNRKLTLIKDIETSADKNPEIIEGFLSVDMKMDSPIVFTNGKETGAVKNIKMEGKKILVQTPDLVYELKVG